MCLGIPGEVVAEPRGELRLSLVSFAGVKREVSLVYLPEAKQGDYVVVHAGFGIAVVDGEAAAQALSLLTPDDPGGSDLGGRA